MNDTTGTRPQEGAGSQQSAHELPHELLRELPREPNRESNRESNREVGLQVLSVLLVEDSRSDYILTRDLLEDIEADEGQPIVLEWADTHEAALRALASGRHDVALVDYLLGAHTGLDVMREALASGCRVPIILLTGQGDREVDALAMRAGASDYLVKGQFEAPALSRSLRYAVGRAHARAALQRAHDELEERVASRTAQLAHLNQELRTENERRAQIEVSLRRAKDEAESANRAKNEFLSRMSHELRTPMNAILGFGQLLEMDELESEQQESVGHILKAGRHLLTLINEVLDIARIEERRLDIVCEPVDLGAALRAARDMIRHSASLRGVSIVQESPDPEPDGEPGPVLLADSQKLQQILLNLLSNAVKFNREGGQVFLSCHATGSNRLRLCVRDTGQGIEPGQMGELFAPFNRLGAEQHGIEGVGLGLALCKSLAEAMGGSVGAQSALGQGSTFWVELPLRSQR